MSGNLVWLNTKFIPEDKAYISVSDPGFLQGYGLFETMRAYEGKIFALEEHLKRLYQGSNILNLNINKKVNFGKIINQTLKINKFYQNTYVRLNVWQKNRGVFILVTVKEYLPPAEKYKTGFKTIIAKKVFINEASIIHKIKSMNRLIYQLAQKEAEGKNKDEVLILNTRGFLTEGSRTNIFLVKKNCLFTPSLDCGCLPGITRQIVLELAQKQGIKIYEKNILSKELFNADEIFLTNSLIEIMPISSCENKPIKIGPITRSLIKEYRNLILK